MGTQSTTQSEDPSTTLTAKISQKPISNQTRCPICELSLIGGNILCNPENVEICSFNQVCQLNIRQRGENVIAVESGCKERTACFNEKRQNGENYRTNTSILNQCRPYIQHDTPSYCRQCCDGPNCPQKIK